jgi:hypothetical protein
MKTDDESHESYVNKVRDLTRRYLQDVLHENERLRGISLSLEAQRDALKERLGAFEEAATKQREERERVAARLADIEAENRRFSDDFLAIEQQNGNLAQLYVASYRLHGTLVRSEVVTAVQEIVINLIGSEDFGIFELRDGKLSLVTSVGIDPDEFGAVKIGQGIIGQVVADGQMRIAAPDAKEPFIACIPLKVNDTVTGAIAIFRLLPQKRALEPIDHELLELLATHAATALYSAGLEERLHKARTPVA